MSIMLNEYVSVRNLRPVVPSWFRQERYDYCDRTPISAGSSIRSIFTRRSGKKNNK